MDKFLKIKFSLVRRGRLVRFLNIILVKVLFFKERLLVKVFNIRFEKRGFGKVRLVFKRKVVVIFIYRVLFVKFKVYFVEE